MSAHDQVFTSWQYLPPFGAGQDTAGRAGPPHTGPEPFFRDAADRVRSAWRSVPEAQYPDGYLGTIVSRRRDRVEGFIKDRGAERSYTRGVHKGERIDPTDYLWSNEVSLMAGVERQAHTDKRWVPAGGGVDVLAHEGKIASAVAGIQELDPSRVDQLAHLRPRWR